MSLVSLQHQLSTPQGFAAAVKHKRGVFTGAIICLIAGLVGVGMNIFTIGTVDGIDWDWSLIGEAYFHPEYFEYGSSRGQMWSYIYTWGPVVLLPLGIILLIVHFVTRGNAGEKLFQQYQANGWIGRQRATALRVANGNQQVQVSLIANAEQPEEQVTTLANQYSQWLTSLDKKQLREVTVAAQKTGVINGVNAAALSNGLPDDMVAAPKVGEHELVIVIPPAPGTTGKTRVLPIKQA